MPLMRQPGLSLFLKSASAPVLSQLGPWQGCLPMQQPLSCPRLLGFLGQEILLIENSLGWKCGAGEMTQ